MYKKNARAKPVRRPRSKRGSKSGAVARRVVPKAVKSYVKRQISANIENKIKEGTLINSVLTTAVSGQCMNTYNLTPLPVIGTTSTDRIGNMISPKYSYIKGQVNCLPYDSTYNASASARTVTIFFVKVKDSNAVATIDTTQFFQLGSTSAGFQNSPLDFLLDINKDKFTLVGKKTMKLGFSAYSTTNGYVTAPSNDTSFSKQFYFRIDNHLKKRLLFNDNVQAVTNDNLWMLIQVNNADGSATDLRPAELHYVIRHTWEDA